MNDDDMNPVDFSEFTDRKPRAPKRRSQVPPTDVTSDDPAVIAAAIAVDSTRLDGKTLEDIAELAMRRMANVILLGGEAFLPKTLKEASDVAKVWASVASLERARLGGKGAELSDSDPVARQARAALLQLRPLQKRQG